MKNRDQKLGSAWATIAHNMTNVIRVIRATIVTNPNACITILIENQKEQSQFEISEAAEPQLLIAMLRRCADRLERENRDGSVTYSGYATATAHGNEEPSIIERPIKKRD